MTRACHDGPMTDRGDGSASGPLAASPPVRERLAPGDAPVVADTADERRASRVERRELLREAAIQAEYATGRHEDTEEAARRGVFRRLGTITLGFIVLIGGLLMLALPGPGILTVIAGLAILAQELPWAARLLEYVKKRSKFEELQAQPMWVQGVMWTFTVAAVAASIVYFAVL